MHLQPPLPKETHARSTVYASIKCCAEHSQSWGFYVVKEALSRQISSEASKRGEAAARRRWYQYLTANV